jgi:hypothetical protein
MEELLKVYAEIIKALGYDVDISNGDIFDMVRNNPERAKSIDGIPIVLPVGEHLKNITGVNNNGQIVKSRCIFNPFKENAIGDTESLNWLRAQIIININSYIFASVKYLLLLLSMDIKDKDLGDYATDFLVEATPKLKKKFTVDEVTLKIWSDIVENSMDGTSDPLCSLTTYRKSKINEGNFTAWVKFNPDIIDKINYQLENGKSGTYNIDKLRVNKNNLEVYKVCLDYVLSTDRITYPYQLETEVVEAPVTTALLEMYNNITKIPFNIIKDLEHLNLSDADWIPLLHENRKTLISRSSIDAIPMLTKTAESILDGNESKPNNKPTNVKPAPIDNNSGKVINPNQSIQPIQTQNVVNQPVHQPIQQAQQQVQHPQHNEPEDDQTKLKRQFGITGGGYGLMAQPRQVVPQPQPIQQPVYTQPVQVVQPMLQQQPMYYQQPIQPMHPVQPIQGQYQVVPNYQQQYQVGPSMYQPAPRYVQPDYRTQTGGIRGNPFVNPLM